MGGATRPCSPTAQTRRSRRWSRASRSGFAAIGSAKAAAVPAGSPAAMAVGRPRASGSVQGAPGGGAEEAALPLVSHLERVVHEGAGLLHGRRGLVLEEAEQDRVVD